MSRKQKIDEPDRIYHPAESPSDWRKMDNFEQTLFTMLFHIPAGRLTTYGDLAKSAGYPNHARQVGKLLSRLPKETKLPWFRVVNAQGSISLSGEAFLRQKLLLEKEGFKVTEQGRVVDFRKYLLANL